MSWLVSIRRKTHPEFQKLLGTYHTINEARFIRDVYRKHQTKQGVTVKIERSNYPAKDTKIQSFLEHLERLEKENANKKVSHKPLVRRT